MDTRTKVFNVKGIVIVDHNPQQFTLLRKNQISLSGVKRSRDESEMIMFHLYVPGVLFVTNEIGLAESSLLGIRHHRFGNKVRIGRCLENFDGGFLFQGNRIQIKRNDQNSRIIHKGNFLYRNGRFQFWTGDLSGHAHQLSRTW